MAIVRRYFYKKKFALAWSWLKCSYLFNNPYQCSKRYRKGRKNSEELLYGETPLTTLEKICQALGVSAHDHIYELGAGSGYTSLWLREWFGCQVTAVEKIPVFCWRLQKAINLFGISGVNIRCEDCLETDYSRATVIYLYGSALEEATIDSLVNKLKALPEGTQIITVSFTLSDYSEGFLLTKQQDFHFEWGEATVFFQVLRSTASRGR